MDKNKILCDYYCLGYEDAKARKKPKVFKFKNPTYFAQDCIWAYNKGYQAGILDLNLNESRKKIDNN